jgi:outer membrane murein-binding lipoprotein Lpp
VIVNPHSKIDINTTQPSTLRNLQKRLENKRIKIREQIQNNKQQNLRSSETTDQTKPLDTKTIDELQTPQSNQREYTEFGSETTDFHEMEPSDTRRTDNPMKTDQHTKEAGQWRITKAPYINQCTSQHTDTDCSRHSKETRGLKECHISIDTTMLKSDLTAREIAVKLNCNTITALIGGIERTLLVDTGASDSCI